MTLRRQLAFAVLVLTLITLGGAFFAIYVTVTRSQERQLDDALLAEAREESREAASLGGERLAISDRPGPAANDVGPLTKYGAIYDAEGRVHAQTATFRGASPPLSSITAGGPGRCFDLWAGGEHLRGVVVPIPGRAGLQLLLAAPRTDLDGDEAFLRRAMLLVFFIAVAWAGATATWIVRRLTRDHRTIAAVARRVAGGDLGARIDINPGDYEVAQLARDLNEMIERLSALVAAQGQFITHAAHELRSPITTLYGELSHALRRARSSEEYRQSIEEALDSAKRLKVLAEDLLTLARINGESDATFEAVPLSAVIDAAVREVAGETCERGVAVVVKGDAGAVNGRPGELQRVFRNLIENAVRHAPRSSEVCIALWREEPGAIVTVDDEGPGIAPVERARVFEPFYRGARAQADDPPGAGLGLAIARAIARAHHGDVTLEDRPGSPGARFVVRLPGT